MNGIHLAIEENEELCNAVGFCLLSAAAVGITAILDSVPLVAQIQYLLYDKVTDQEISGNRGVHPYYQPHDGLIESVSGGPICCIGDLVCMACDLIEGGGIEDMTYREFYDQPWKFVKKCYKPTKVASTALFDNNDIPKKRSLCEALVSNRGSPP